jgi:2-C-methyl-D-erythritol 4-phosphate cytidylyltransferase / 2-C-methyl-D-erythritol 2,4-cyclodiphosphate synthase
MTAFVAALVLAAGRGVRSGSEIPKQYRRIGEDPVVRWSLCRLLAHPDVKHVQPVIHPDDAARFAVAAAGLDLPEPVAGGATRQDSVMAGLAALEKLKPDLVLVHDAARPFASTELISRAIAAGMASGAAIPALPVADTVKKVDKAGRIVATLERDALRIVQTPQAFAFDQLLAAHRRAAQAGRHDFSDDAALAEWAGLPVTTFEGQTDNVKLTTSDDFWRATRDWSALVETRTAMGFDVHAFGPGDHVMLGGIAIAHARGLAGHSDADVALHALVDAILGALAEGDIGAHFPPSDPQWRNAASDRFLHFAVKRVAARKGQIAHLDLTLVCEQPKIGPHREKMRARIAELAGISIDRVAVKATTSEGLGFTGRGEGIAAYAMATLRLPRNEADAG